MYCFMKDISRFLTIKKKDGCIMRKILGIIAIVLLAVECCAAPAFRVKNCTNTGVNVVLTPICYADYKSAKPYLSMLNKSPAYFCSNDKLEFSLKCGEEKSINVSFSDKLSYWIEISSLGNEFSNNYLRGLVHIWANTPSGAAGMYPGYWESWKNRVQGEYKPEPILVAENPLVSHVMFGGKSGSIKDDLDPMPVFLRARGDLFEILSLTRCSKIEYKPSRPPVPRYKHDLT